MASTKRRRRRIWDALRRSKARTDRWTRLAALAGLAGVAGAAPAKALENFFPYMPGLTLGVPIGTLPPPGTLYFANSLYGFDGDIRNGSGGSIAKMTAEVELPIFCYNTGLKVLGASYGLAAVVPFSAVQLRSPAGRPNEGGQFNPYIAPVDLSWQLRPNLFVSLLLGAYLPIGDYHLDAPLNIANNFTTYESTLGVTYVEDGWTFTGDARLDFNTVNPANHYHSGDIFFIDYAAEKTIGAWKAGLGGYVADQFTNDTIDGVVVPASPYNSLGREAFKTGLGPMLEYDFGKSNVTLTYERDIAGRNYGSGNDVFLRFATLLY